MTRDSVKKATRAAATGSRADEQRRGHPESLVQDQSAASASEGSPKEVLRPAATGSKADGAETRRLPPVFFLNIFAGAGILSRAVSAHKDVQVMFP